MSVELKYPRPPLRTLSQAQYDQFHRDGYLLMPGVLPQADIDRIVPEIDRLWEREVEADPNHDRAKRFDGQGILHESKTFLELIDHPAMFGVLLDLMGPYLQFSLATVTAHPPNPVFKGFLHCDGGPALQRIRVSETSWPLAAKILWFLTDTSKADMGNIVFVPGSHLRPFPEEGGHNEFGELPSATTPGTTQVMAKPGDALVFTHSLWHGGAANLSTVTRKNVQYGYSQGFFRNYDYDEIPQHVVEWCTPRQRRLLGVLDAGAPPHQHYYPPADQVKLMFGD
jgi:hypothetical protein